MFSSHEWNNGKGPEKYVHGDAFALEFITVLQNIRLERVVGGWCRPILAHDYQKVSYNTDNAHRY